MRYKVCESNRNYLQHIKDVYNRLLPYGQPMAVKFIKHYRSRFDCYNRSYLNYKIAYSLLDDYYQVKKSGIRWYGCVGVGGTGKSTLGKNLAYWFDKSFTEKQIVTTFRELVTNLRSFPTINSMKSILMDEPDSTIHPNSREGKLMRSIFGKARQQQLFMIYCATDMNDIPDWIFKKLSGIFFTPVIGRAMFFKDQPQKKAYIMEKIKQKYKKDGYEIFYKFQKSKACIPFDTTKRVPLTAEQEAGYITSKANDYDKSLEHVDTLLNHKETHPGRRPPKEHEDSRIPIIRKLINEGKSYSEIGKLYGVTKTRIGQLINYNY